MFQQSALCHTTSPSKRREKGEQEKWKTSLQSKLFIEIVEIRSCLHYDKIWSLVFTKNIKHFVVTSFFVFVTLFTLEAYGRFHVSKKGWSRLWNKKVHWCSCQRAKGFVTWQKVLGVPTFLFGDTNSVKERILVGGKKIVGSRNGFLLTIFLQNKQHFA